MARRLEVSEEVYRALAIRERVACCVEGISVERFVAAATLSVSYAPVSNTRSQNIVTPEILRNPHGAAHT